MARPDSETLPCPGDGLLGGHPRQPAHDRVLANTVPLGPPRRVALPPAEAGRLRGADPSPGQHVVVDLAQYAAATAGVRKAAAEGSS